VRKVVCDVRDNNWRDNNWRWRTILEKQFENKEVAGNAW